MVGVYEEIWAEREFQDSKWGEQNHEPERWCLIAGEEFGEVNKAVLERDPDSYRDELIQLAAVCVAAVEALDRKYPK